MTEEEATDWVVNFVRATLGYEYFTKREHAEIAANAMSLLSRKQWHIVVTNNGENDCHWVQVKD